MKKNSFSWIAFIVLQTGLLEQAQVVTDDSQLVSAIQNRRSLSFLQAAQLTVTQVLPDDNVGLKHQKFVVQTSRAQSVMIVYNLDLCPRVPVRVGDRVAVGGEFIWSGRSALVHWTHYDPQSRRPSGYIYHNNLAYCYR